MKIDKETIKKYYEARKQSDDLATIWADIAAECETEKEYEICKNISRSFQEIEYDYFFLIKALIRYNENEEQKEREKKFKWNTEATK